MQENKVNVRRLQMLRRRLMAVCGALQGGHTTLVDERHHGRFIGASDDALVRKTELVDVLAVRPVPDEMIGQLVGRFSADALGWAALDPGLRAEGLQAHAVNRAVVVWVQYPMTDNPTDEGWAHTGTFGLMDFFGLERREVLRVFSGDLNDESFPSIESVLREVDRLLAKYGRQDVVPLAQAA